MDGYSLRVRDVDMSDAGNYTCVAVNDAGLLVVPLQLQVFGGWLRARQHRTYGSMIFDAWVCS